MQKINEFAIPTMLASAWVNLVLGKDKIKEALNIYNDLIKKYGSSFILLQGVGLCHLAMLQFNDSEKSLLEALEKVLQSKSKELKFYIFRIQKVLTQ